MLKHLVACFITLFTITGCNKNKQEEAVLRVVTSADQAPFEFFNAQSNEIEGFDIDLIKEIGRRLDLKVIVTDMDFGGILPSLQSGQADMAIAGITRTPEREKTIDFSVDYYQPRLALLSKSDNVIATLKDQKLDRIGAQLGTFHHALLEEEAKNTDMFDVVARNRLLDLVQELISENIEAVVMDYTPALKFQESNGNLLAVKEFKHPSVKGYAIGLPKNSPLKIKLDTVIKQLIKEGFIGQLEKKWLANSDKVKQ